jgi:hypothetical protein
MSSVPGRALLLAALALVLAACDGDEDRQEVIAKLRGIGAGTTPLVSEPSVAGEAPKVVAVTVYAALPDGETATIEPYSDLPGPFALSLPVEAVTIDTASVKYDALPGFQLLSFKAALAVPEAAYLEPLGGAGQVRYGFFLKSGDEEEKMVGSFMVYPKDSPELAWTNPEIAVVTPTEGETVSGDVDLEATIVDPNDEGLKLGWFVSDGEIKNRRAKETVWAAPGAGEHTLIVTAHGKRSRGFAMKVVSVTTE